MTELDIKEALECLNKLTRELHSSDRVLITIKDTITGEKSPLVLERHHSIISIELSQRSNIIVNSHE